MGRVRLSHGCVFCFFSFPHSDFGRGIPSLRTQIDRKNRILFETFVSEMWNSSCVFRYLTYFRTFLVKIFYRFIQLSLQNAHLGLGYLDCFSKCNRISNIFTQSGSLFLEDISPFFDQLKTHLYHCKKSTISTPVFEIWSGLVFFESQQ